MLCAEYGLFCTLGGPWSLSAVGILKGDNVISMRSIVEADRLPPSLHKK